MALGYLISPALQLEDINGKPLVGGYIRVFRHGTTNPYITWKDFHGHRNPASVPLNTLGMAILLADENELYDVYCYDRNGVQQWSRLNVGTITMGGGGEEPGEVSNLAHWIATGGESATVEADTTTRLPFPINPEYDGTFVTHLGTDYMTLAEGLYLVNCVIDYKQDPDELEPVYADLTVNTGCPYDDIAWMRDWSSPEATSDRHSIRCMFIRKVGDYDTLSFGVSSPAGLTFANIVRLSVIKLDNSSSVVWEYYDAGSGIDITDNIISADMDVVQGKLTAGDNITIVDDVISAAEQQQADWEQSDTSAVDYIKNKPTNLVQDADYHHTDENFTSAEKTKLSGIESGAEVNVQANWNESDSSSDAYIQNKPTIPSGSQLVPSATPSDAGEVLTVDQQGVPAWAPAQATISAGNGVDITNNVVSAKVDGTTIGFNASGELESLSVDNDSAFLAHYGTTTYAEISAAVAAGKAVFVTDVSGAITAVMPMTSYNTNPAMVIFTLLIGSIEYKATLSSGTWSATTVDIQADWNEASQLAPSYINNKPTIPSGVQLVPSATSADEDKVLTVDQNGVPGWAAAASQVQSDWAEADPADVSFIQNKPGQTNLVAGTNITIVDDVQNNTVTISSTGGGTQVQADWAESDPNDPSYIQNKPDLSVYATNTALTNGLATKQDTISDLATIRSGAAAGATAVQPADLATVATTGDYADLLNTPSIPVIGTITL